MDEMHDRDDQHLAGLPEHESDADVEGEMGGGVLGAGGTAVDRGTGERTGIAQGPEADEDSDDDVGLIPGGPNVNPLLFGGGTGRAEGTPVVGLEGDERDR